MRLLEITLVLFNVLLLGWLTLGRPKTQRGWLIGGGISTALLLIHAFVEGLRWPMIPVYLITLWAIVGGTRLFFRSAAKAKKKTATALENTSADWSWGGLCCRFHCSAPPVPCIFFCGAHRSLQDRNRHLPLDRFCTGRKVHRNIR